jgi:hypothetical protein
VNHKVGDDVVSVALVKVDDGLDKAGFREEFGEFHNAGVEPLEMTSLELPCPCAQALQSAHLRRRRGQFSSINNRYRVQKRRSDDVRWWSHYADRLRNQMPSAAAWNINACEGDSYNLHFLRGLLVSATATRQ